MMYTIINTEFQTICKTPASLFENSTGAFYIEEDGWVAPASRGPLFSNLLILTLTDFDDIVPFISIQYLVAIKLNVYLQASYLVVLSLAGTL